MGMEWVLDRGGVVYLYVDWPTMCCLLMCLAGRCAIYASVCMRVCLCMCVCVCVLVCVRTCAGE